MIENLTLKFDVYAGVQYRLRLERIVHCDIVLLSSHFTEVCKERSVAFLSLQVFSLQFSPKLSTVYKLQMWHLKFVLPFYAFCNIIICIILTYSILTYSMEQSPSWEANRFSASQEIPRISRYLKFHYNIHKCPSSDPILSQLEY